MKIAFVGSREFRDKEFVILTVERYMKNGLCDEVISGGAAGPDTWAEEVAKAFRMKTTIFLPDWNKHGKKAGFLRNIDIVQACDKVIAFWDGKSKGTKSTIDLAISNKKIMDIFVR